MYEFIFNSSRVIQYVCSLLRFPLDGKTVDMRTQGCAIRVRQTKKKKDLLKKHALCTEKKSMHERERPPRRAISNNN